MERISPDRAWLQAAHIKLRTPMPLDEMLKNPCLKIVLEAVARRLMQRRQGSDLKKLQANDHD